MAAGPRGTVSAIIGTLAFIGNHNSVNDDTTFGLSINHACRDLRAAFSTRNPGRSSDQQILPRRPGEGRDPFRRYTGLFKWRQYFTGLERFVPRSDGPWLRRGGGKMDDGRILSPALRGRGCEPRVTVRGRRVRAPPVPSVRFPKAPRVPPASPRSRLLFDGWYDGDRGPSAAGSWHSRRRARVGGRLRGLQQR